MWGFNIGKKRKNIIAAVILSAALIGSNADIGLPVSHTAHAEGYEASENITSEEAVAGQEETAEVEERAGVAAVIDEESSDATEPVAEQNVEVTAEAGSADEGKTSGTDAGAVEGDASEAGATEGETPEANVAKGDASESSATDEEEVIEPAFAADTGDISEAANTATGNEPATPETTGDDSADSENDATGSNSADATSADGSNNGVVSEEPVVKPTLTLRSMSLAKTYDGKPLTNGSEALEVETGWKEGNGADYTFTETQTAVGSTLNKFTITPWPGTNLEDYVLDVSYGDLTVLERLDSQKYILTITGIGGSTKYNGQLQTLNGFTLSGRSDYEYQVAGSGDPAEAVSFTVGDATFSVSGIAAGAEGVNAGTYLVDITGSPVVTDAYGNDVTSEFSFEYYAGSFSIEKRNVTLTSGSAKKKYDGEKLTDHTVTVSGDGFVEGEGATYTFKGKQKDVGVSYNYFNYELNEGTLKSNYDIETVPGKLKVVKADKQEEANNTEGS